MLCVASVQLLNALTSSHLVNHNLPRSHLWLPHCVQATLCYYASSMRH